MTQPVCRDDAALGAFIEAYESAQAAHGTAQVSDFLPPPEHPLFSQVLRELIRVELEYGWQRGRPESLEHYQDAFPQLRSQREALTEIAFEEYRLRAQAGDVVSPQEYQERFGVDTTNWPTPCAEAFGRHAQAADYDLSRVALAYHDVRNALGVDGGAHLADWMKSLPPDSGPARLFHDLHESHPDVAARLATAVTTLPEPECDFAGFRLIAELGRGAFGRVYLARQPELAQRLVALKVTSCLFQESQHLAQLRHPHIVPVYSVHKALPFQAVCMPYLGAATLADVCQELTTRNTPPESGQFFLDIIARKKLLPRPVYDNLSRSPVASLRYVDACLWIAARLAEALAHAHELGILHRDLKPANVLLTDDAAPMLLDFNLADDIKERSPLSVAMIGGTLPYMSPEHLRAQQAGQTCADARSDIYSLGLILYELLAGRYPYPQRRGPLTPVVAQILADRRKPLPLLQSVNRTVTPAVASVVQHCLEGAVAARYQTARQLAEDLNRHLEHESLRHAAEPSAKERAGKWMRRHPRLSSAIGVGAVAVVAWLIVFGLFWARGQRLQRLEAIDALNAFRDDNRRVNYQFMSYRPGEAAQLEEGKRIGQGILDRYRVLDDADWQSGPLVLALSNEDQQWLRQELGEFLLLWSRMAALPARANAAPDVAGLRESLRLNQIAEACFRGTTVPRLLWVQRAEVLKALGEEEAAEEAMAHQPAAGVASARDLCLQAAEESLRRRYGEARRLLLEAAQMEPQNFRIWLDLGICNERLGRYADAAACFGTCIALWPQFAPLYLKRAAAYLENKNYAQARADCNTALQMQRDDAEALTGADHCEAYVLRALAYLAEKQAPAALDDLTRALDYPHPTRVYFMRAHVRERTGDFDGARRDRATGLKLEPTDERSWVARGFARMASDPQGALADFDQALALNPASGDALQKKAHVLSERLDRPHEAVAALTRLLEYFPESVPALSGRGVVLARLGKRLEAHRDAEETVRLDRSPRILYQVACIYALTSRTVADDRKLALQWLETALRDGAGWEYLAKDADLDPIRTAPEFRDVVERARREAKSRGAAQR